MNHRFFKGWCVATVAAGTALAMTSLQPLAHAAPTYQPIAQTSMTAVAADSVEPNQGNGNGPIQTIVDHNPNSYWHTKWNGGKDPLPHWFVVDLGQDVTNLAQITLTPRQDSNGSGRAHDFTVGVSSDARCAVADSFSTKELADAFPFTQVTTRSVPADPDGGKQADVVVTFPQPVSARCVKVTYTSSYGGDNTAEEVATLAEFNAAVLSDEASQPGTQPTAPTTPAGNGPTIHVPNNAFSITDGTVLVRTHPDFPQIVDYQLQGKQLAGQYGQALTTITIGGTPRTVTVGDVTQTENSVTYPLTFQDLPGVSMNAQITVDDGALTYTLTDITDPNAVVSTIAIPGLNMVSLNATDTQSLIFAAKPITESSKNTALSGDDTVVLADPKQTELPATSAWMVVASNSQLAAGFETNAIPDGSGKNDVRFNYAVTALDGVKVGTVSPAAWVYRSAAVSQYDTGTGIGVNDDPFISVKITGDVNHDNAVDWQDGAIVTRDILTPIVGQDDVKNRVVTRIPFNFGSQATHPFLRVLDDTKRVSLATDGLGQQVMLKGYQGEGHDSAHGDYAGHYNQRAGGLDDLKTLVNEGKNWNATFGIHVNAQESYSEANCFALADQGYKSDKVAAPCLLQDPPVAAWNWMNQAFALNQQLDLASGNVIARTQQLREDFPLDENGESNLNWLYWDTYLLGEGQADRFSTEMQKNGWRISSEYADSLPRFSTWAHHSADPVYGSADSGLNSALIRFVENSYRDTFSEHPLLGQAKITEYEGWQGRFDYNTFNKGIWESNLPAKFLQQSDIMTLSANKATFANGTVVTNNTGDPKNRTIVYDGATIFKPGGTYLLPWKDGGQDRLYYWNPTNQPATWQLTDAFASQDSLTLYQLTDTGRQKVADLPVSDGSVTLPQTQTNTAYVLYPSAAVEDVSAPNWGQASHINDPGFYSGTLAAYQGANATVTRTDRGNYQAQLLGGDSAQLGQQITLPAGQYSAWAWVEIQPGQQRSVQVVAYGNGINPTANQTGQAGMASTSITASSAVNQTASDEKHGTYFQRVPVHFTTDGSPFYLLIQAGAGDAVVNVDDLRVVPYTVPEATNAVEGTTVFQDFENVDTGYYPFVTGTANSGDAKTQLAEKHAPYSQSGWNNNSKLVDNVLDGEWSLLSHEENAGLILRTTQATVPLLKGHTYQVSFDYQASVNNSYQAVFGHDDPTEGGWTPSIDQTWPLAQARGQGWVSDGQAGPGTAQFQRTFTVTSDAPTFIGVTQTGAGVQNDLSLDNFRVVDLGERPYFTLSAGEIQRAKDGDHAQVTLTTSVSVPEGVTGAVTGVKHEISVPDGWTLTQLTQATTVATKDKPSVATWSLTAPKTALVTEVSATGSWLLDGRAQSGTDSALIDPSSLPLLNPIGGDDLLVVGVDSEETSAEKSAGANAADGDVTTFWHTKYSGGTDEFPHWIVLKPKASDDAQNVCVFTGLEYTARQNGANGRAKGYQIFVSKDGQNWGDAVASGEFADVTTPQVVEFDHGVEGPYVKLVETSSHNGAPFGGAAEIRLGGVCAKPGAEPEVSSSSQPSASGEPGASASGQPGASASGEPGASGGPSASGEPSQSSGPEPSAGGQSSVSGEPGTGSSVKPETPGSGDSVTPPNPSAGASAEPGGPEAGSTTTPETPRGSGEAGTPGSQGESAEGVSGGSTSAGGAETGAGKVTVRSGLSATGASAGVLTAAAVALLAAGSLAVARRRQR